MADVGASAKLSTGATSGAGVFAHAGGASGEAKLTATHKLIITLVIAAVIILIYLYIQSGQHNSDQPRSQWDMNALAGVMYEKDLSYGGSGDHMLSAEEQDYPTVYLPLRYPGRTGHNVSTVIHHGFNAMMRPAPQDEDWMCNPPSEVDL